VFRSLGAWGMLLVACGVALADPPPHLVAAHDLVERLPLDRTSYVLGQDDVQWEGSCHSHADCSGFLRALLSHCYGYDSAAYRRWLNSTRPSASLYHDAIVAQAGFLHVEQFAEIQPGDILAAKYLQGRENTGHVMVVAGPPRPMAPAPPLVPGTTQWEVPIIDSSKSGHGSTDTRYRKGPNGTDQPGLGRGVLRVYVDAAGHVAGYTWSTYQGSTFRAPQDEHLVIGRLKPGFRP
jgi:hypothetical protein